MEQCLAEVSDYLGEERYGWLAACAVYPDLRWELTLFLGHRLEQANGAGTCLLSLEHVAALVRLPWFRAGFLPDWLRRRLVDDLSATSDRTVRRALGELLLSSLDGPVDAFALEIAQTNTRTVDQLWRRAVRRWRGEEESGGVLHDRVFLTHMNSSLALQVPRQVGRLLRSAGRRLAHASPTMGALAPRRLWEAWAATAAMGVMVSAMTSPSSSMRGKLLYVWVTGIVLASLSGLILAASSRHRLRFGYARLVGELTILITLGILSTPMASAYGYRGTDVVSGIGQFVLHGAGELPPGFLAVAAVLGLPYFWLIRQHRLRSRWDRWIDPIGRAVDAWLPDRILRRLLSPRTRTAQQDKAIDALTVRRRLWLSAIVHFAIMLPVMLGTMNNQIWHETVWVGGPILALNGLVMTWLSRGVSRRGMAVGLSSLLLMGSVVAVAAGSSATRLEVASVVNGYGVVSIIFLIELLGTSIQMLVLMQAACVLLAVCMAWLEIGTIVVSGFLLSLTGGWLAWRSRHTSRWAVAAGLSASGMSLVCYTVIAANGWGRTQAQLPVSIMLTVYLVAFTGLVVMYLS